MQRNIMHTMNMTHATYNNELVRTAVHWTALRLPQMGESSTVIKEQVRTHITINQVDHGPREIHRRGSWLRMVLTLHHVSDFRAAGV